MAGTASLTISRKNISKAIFNPILRTEKWQQSFKHQQMPEYHTRTRNTWKSFHKTQRRLNSHCTQSESQKFTRSCFTNLCEHVWTPLLQNKQDAFLSHAKNSSTGGISALKASVISQNYHRGGFRVMSGSWMTEAREALYYKKSVQK